MQDARIAGPAFRGCPFQNTGSEIADADHPAKAVTLEYRQWLHALFTSLVREAGIDEVDVVAGALIVLHDGASASAQVVATRKPADMRGGPPRSSSTRSCPSIGPRLRRSNATKSEVRSQESEA
jgi:hypothetical protein